MDAASTRATDYHVFSWDDWAAENLVPPRILGHELAGTVAAAGAGVLTLWLQSTYTTNSATFNMRITC
jgi:threonine dehydrogenase-like Zn-dependent dehydrogenase